MRALQTDRHNGWVFCDWQARDREGPPTADELDEFVYRALGDEANTNHKGRYREISIAEARRVVAHWMQYSLAYGPMLTDVGRSSETAESFFCAFSASARYFTNYEPLSPTAHAFTPKTVHTFDSGIVAVDEAALGTIWFADED